MKVLWLSHFIPYPPKGGMLLRSYNLIKQLGQEFDVHLVALERRDTLAGMYSSIDAGIAEAKSELQEHCKSVTLVPTKIGAKPGRSKSAAARAFISHSPYIVSWLGSKLFEEAAVDLLKSQKFDVVHVDTIGIASLIDKIESLSNAKIVLNHHNIESDMLLKRASKQESLLAAKFFEYESKKLRRYETRYCKRFDLNITCSEEDSDRLRDIDPNVLAVEVPNGVDIDYFGVSSIAERSDSLVFVGSLGWYPNKDAMHFFAEDIWPVLSESRSECTFDLIGRSPSNLLSGLAEKDARFKVHGFVDDIRPMVHEAAVYVCPIRDGGGTKLKILDALSLGKAIVAHPMAVDGIGTTPGTDVLLAETPKQFVSQIEYLLDKPLERRRLEHNARCLAETSYSFDFIGSKFRDVYRRLLS